MIRKTVAVVISVLMAVAICVVPASPALANDPGIWTKADGVNEITPALTEGTATFADDEAREFVHPIEWEKTPLNDETTWRGEADGADGSIPDGAINATEALAWVYSNIGSATDEDNYGVTEAWANPEKTLTQGSGDCEDMAFLLASLLKFHTNEVDIAGGDLVYAECGFLLPPDEDFHAWVFWWDASGPDWHQLDPTSGEMNHILYPALGTLWLNNEHAFGFLPGYYPGPWEPVGGYNEDDFGKIADHGFEEWDYDNPEYGGAMNNYAWSMTEFNGDLYVGTGRNCGYLMVSGWLGRLGIELPEGIVTKLTSPADMQAEIWRYRDGEWTRVHQATPGEGVGYRTMTTFNGAIYAGVGAGHGPTLMLTSIDGNTWIPVNHTGLEGSNTRGMTVHRGKLYVGTSVNGTAAIFASADPATGWTQVADFSGTPNSEVTSLKSFNGYLYASTAGTLGSGGITGFEVWRSTIYNPTNPDVLGGGHWKQVVKDGAGDSRNYWSASMEVFNAYLYVGSISLPIMTTEHPEFLLQTFKGFDLIRIDKGDNWELVAGSYPGFVGIPNDTTAERGIPISGLPAGFGNPMNFYCWSLEEHDDILYLGTLGAETFLRCLPTGVLADLLGEIFGIPVEPGQIEQMQDMLEPFAGADLWKTNDGIHWEPVTLNGFNEPHNYGIRTMFSGSLYVGTANPFVGYGCEVWQAPIPTGQSCNIAGNSKDDFFMADNVYATGSGFTPNSQVNMHVVPIRNWEQGDTIPADVSSDGMNTLTTNHNGDLLPTAIWPASLTPGGYDIVFDANQNGIYEPNYDVVDSSRLCYAGFRVSPAVGGEAYPVNKAGLMLPWIALGMAIIAGATILRRRHRAQS